MNKNKIQKFAVQARRDLIEQVKQQAFNYGIDENGYGDKNAVSVNGIVLSSEKKSQRMAFITAIENEGYEQVIEKVAYTWFNRFIALRFMEVNDYLPTHIRVLSDETGEFKPEILKHATTIELLDKNGSNLVNKERVFELLKNPEGTEDLYRYLLLTQCKSLHHLLPKMFENISTNDFTELLLPIKILSDESAIAHLVNDIDENDFKEAVEIIGWLYQYYNTEPKEKVIDIFKGTAIKKDDIPAATQIFTTDWVVRYMVDNSLGKYWIERNPSSKLAKKLQYFITPKNGEINYINERITPEEMTFFDPCMGSGHILVYAFDVLLEIYLERGYKERDAVANIIEKNLFGLDIDARAYQLAYFALMMKARSIDRRFLTKELSPQVYCPQDSDELENFGSIFIVGELGVEPTEPQQLTLDNMDWKKGLNNWNFRRLLTQKYAVVCTNPPYLNKYNPTLKKYVTDNYKDYSGDLFSVFIYKNFDYCKPNGYSAFMTPNVWMFIKTYEKLREYIIKNKSISSLIQICKGAFYKEATVDVMGFVLKNTRENEKGLYIRLEDFKGDMEVQKQKVLEALANKECGYFYETSDENFSKIPGSPIAYWISKKMLNAFENGEILKTQGDTRQGMATSDNNRFLRIWSEIDYNKIGLNCSNADEALSINQKWYPYNKGGEFRKWYGNIDYTINYENDGSEVKEYATSLYKTPSRTIKSISEYFKPCLSWSKISSGSIAFRYYPKGFVFDVAGCCIFYKSEDKMLFDFGFLNSKISKSILSAISPTLNYEAGHIASLPIIEKNGNESVIKLTYQNISLSKTDWDSFETSWDFRKHPLAIVLSEQCLVDSNSTHSSLPTNHYIKIAYKNWETQCAERFNQLKANEETLNAIFIQIYDLATELTPEVEDKDVTVRLADKTRDIKSFISYAVGCMFGRYSLDVDGLAYAGGRFSDQWLVISGKNYKREVIEKYVSDELQRVDCLAEIYEFSGRDLQIGKISSERGTVCSIESDEESNCINPFQYRRGTTKELYKGICILSINSQRIESGIGNTIYDLCSTEILNAITSGNSDELVSRGWEDAKRIDWKTIHYKLTTNHYNVDADNIVPICDDEYFEDDIVGRFIKFVEVVYGTATLEENLEFIASALGTRGTAREVIRNYFLNSFYVDHCKTYSKRPVYWQFDSGKKNGFKALIYMHRYESNLLARMRTDYVHEQQERYRTQIAHIEDMLLTASNKDKVALTKTSKKLAEQAQEILKFQEKVQHLAEQKISIDLDDGVVKNYALFSDIVTKIK